MSWMGEGIWECSQHCGKGQENNTPVSLNVIKITDRNVQH